MFLKDFELTAAETGVVPIRGKICDGIIFDPENVPQSFTPTDECPLDVLLMWSDLPFVVTSPNGYEVWSLVRHQRLHRHHTAHRIEDAIRYCHAFNKDFSGNERYLPKAGYVG